MSGEISPDALGGARSARPWHEIVRVTLCEEGWFLSLSQLNGIHEEFVYSQSLLVDDAATSGDSTSHARNTAPPRGVRADARIAIKRFHPLRHRSPITEAWEACQLAELAAARAPAPGCLDGPPPCGPNPEELRRRYREIVSEVIARRRERRLTRRRRRG